MTMTRVSTAFALALLLAPSAQADDLGQGEARITARSDVTMSVESGPRTTSMKINAIAKHLGTPLGTIKRCYAGVVKETPEVHGQIHVALTYPPKGPLKVGLNPLGVDSKKLKRCVHRAFTKLRLGDVRRPAMATVKLEFSNSAADAAHHVDKKQQQMAKVDVKTADDGSLYSEDGTADGKVAFRIEATPKAGPGAITAAHHGLEHALPRLLDCRRHAAKRSSPAGEVKLHVSLSPSGKAQIRAVSSSVKNPNAKTCSQTALRRASFDKGRGRVTVTVRFSG